MRPDADCNLCSLHACRTNIVLPSGSEDSPVAFVGEAPGETEDHTGRPFVGRSGKILDKVMSDAGLDRSKVLITNTVKCRPPGNRDPTEEEMAACRPFLHSELCGCKVVVGLGKSACRALLGYDGRMMDIVNTRMEMDIGDRKIPFIPTYHPAACIYRRESMTELERTMRIVVEEYMR